MPDIVWAFFYGVGIIYVVKSVNLIDGIGGFASALIAGNRIIPRYYTEKGNQDWGALYEGNDIIALIGDG